MAEEKEMTSKELQQLLKQDEDTRKQKCLNEVNAVLQKYGCQLFAIPQFTPDGRTTAITTVQVLPNK